MFIDGPICPAPVAPPAATPAPVRPRDDLDEAVDRLTAIEDEGEFGQAIFEAWHSLDESDWKLPPSCLFAPLGGLGCACPTVVKSGDFRAATEYLTAFVRSQDIPSRWQEIRRHHLPTFAAIQREARRVLGTGGGR